MGMAEYVVDANECDQQSLVEKGIRQQIQDQKLVSEFCNLLQETN